MTPRSCKLPSGVLEISRNVRTGQCTGSRRRRGRPAVVARAEPAYVRAGSSTNQNGPRSGPVSTPYVSGPHQLRLPGCGRR